MPTTNESLVEVKNEKTKTLALTGTLNGSHKKGAVKIPDAKNFTVMPAVCGCGKALTLHLQGPSSYGISWQAFCTGCTWTVCVTLKK